MLKFPLAVASALLLSAGVAAAAEPSTSSTTTYHDETVDGVRIFYREAGPRRAPAVVLLHGFPSSSRQYNALIPLLADRYHIVAPDYPGFGNSDSPPPSQYSYTFDHLAMTISSLLDQLGVNRYTLFMQDYGARSDSALHLRIPTTCEP